MTINGAPVGVELNRYYLKDELTKPESQAHSDAGARKETDADGSVIIVIATDAPLDSRNLRRMAARAIMGLARTGAAGSNGSGDFVIAFSSSLDVRIRPQTTADRNLPRNLKSLSNDSMSPLFWVIKPPKNNLQFLFKATTTTGNGHTVGRFRCRTIEILRRHGSISN